MARRVERLADGAGGRWSSVGGHRLLVAGRGDAARLLAVEHPSGCPASACDLFGASDAWREFSGFDTARVTMASAPDRVPSAFSLIGGLHAVEYLSDKFDGKLTLYRHDFGEGRGGRLPVLAGDGSKRQLWILGGAYTINARGIVG